jgi:ribosomal-protein-alanine N-acetyltransferase
MTVLTLERLRWWHLDAVVAMEPELFAPDDWSYETWLSEVAQPHNDYVVVVDPEVVEVVGVAGLATSPHGEGYVQTIGVRREHQGHGHGAGLLAALVARAAERGMETMGLEVRDDNASALRLYAKAGFASIGRRRGYYGHPGHRRDALVLQCPDLGGALHALGGAPEVVW